LGGIGCVCRPSGEGNQVKSLLFVGAMSAAIVGLSAPAAAQGCFYHAGEGVEICREVIELHDGQLAVRYYFDYDGIEWLYHWHYVE
jgi:hypothetical protein